MLALLILFCLTTGAFAQSSASSDSGASSAASASSHVSSSGSTKPQLMDGLCPNIVGVPLDMTRKAGEWYEVQRSVNDYHNSDRCEKSIWRKPVNGVSTVINKSVSNAALVTETTVLRVKQKGHKTCFNYHVPILGNVHKKHLYLDIDYDHYVIAWNCENRGDKHIETSFVLSRRPKLPRNIDQATRNAFAKFNLTMPEMITYDLSNCCQAYASYNYCEDI